MCVFNSLLYSPIQLDRLGETRVDFTVSKVNHVHTDWSVELSTQLRYDNQSSQTVAAE